MELNDRTISEIANQLGLSGGKNVQKDTLAYLSSKSDVELEREILKIREKLARNNISYEKQIELLKNIAPMMDPKQRARLNKVMEIMRK